MSSIIEPLPDGDQVAFIHSDREIFHSGLRSHGKCEKNRLPFIIIRSPLDFSKMFVFLSFISVMSAILKRTEIGKLFGYLSRI